MRTMEFISVVNDEAKKLCLENSENPAKLQEIFDDKNFDLVIRFEDVDFFFPDDKEKRQIFTFKIVTKNGTYSHRFGMSLYDTRKIDKKLYFPTNMKIHVLYNVLTSLNFYVPENLNNFTNEFGYDLNTNYKQVTRIHQDCLDQYKNCVKLFGGDFTEYFPS